MRTLRWVLTVLLTASWGCGGGAASGAFGPTFPDNQSADVAGILARLAEAAPRRDAPVAVGVSSNGELFAYDMEGGSTLWTRPAEVRAGPFLAGDVVVTQETSGIVGRDLRDGEVLFEEEDEAMHLMGADGESATGAIVLSTGGGVGAHSQLISVEGGAVAWSADVDHALGAPAVLGGMFFVPWGNQNVSVLDAHSGEELARVRVTDAVISTAIARGGAVWFGQEGVFRFDGAITGSTREQTSSYTPALGDLPGRPSFLRDAYQPPPAPTSATHRIRLAFHPDAASEGVTIENDAIYLIFYRLVFALEPTGSGVRWVHEHEHDLVGVRALSSGLLVADEAGRLSILGAADGRPTWSAETGVGATFVELPASFRAGGAPTGEAAPLRDQLLSAAQSTDARLVPARVLSVAYLAALPEPEVTGNLVALCDDRDAPETVRGAACTALAERRDGADHVITALGRHSAFLEQTTAPPVGPLARAAVTMGEQRAVPPLLAHLRDPETGAAELPQLLGALGALGNRAAAAPVRDFLRLYHADSADDEMVTALMAAIDALVILEGPVARETLEEIAGDALTIPPLRGRARQALRALEEQAENAEAAEQASQQEQEEQAENAEAAEEVATQEETLPERITVEIATRVLGPVRRELLVCLGRAEGRPRSARLIIRLDGTGAIERVSASPEATQSCIEPLVRSQTWPANRRSSRQQVIYTVRR